MIVDSQPEIKKMTLDDVRPTVNKRIDDMEELYAMDKDSLIKIARHYRWNSEAMDTQWFEQKGKLEFELGIVFDKSLPIKHPHMNSSLMKFNKDSLCLICYDMLTPQNKFALEQCGHTFCKGCWTEYLEKKVDEGS